MNHQISIGAKTDEYYTIPKYVYPIMEHIPKSWRILCPFDKKDSAFVSVFSANGYEVQYGHIDEGKDFFAHEYADFDCIISNPPYSKREAILEKLYRIGKPFAMLINETGLFDSKKRFDLLSTNPFEIMMFDHRISYRNENDTQKTSPPFKSIYLCSNILPSKFVFIKNRQP